MGMACSNHKDQSSKFKDQSYVSPVDYEIVLAGNFGEPRPWHFHGGIDIKTGNQEGKQIFSIADGLSAMSRSISTVLAMPSMWLIPMD